MFINLIPIVTRSTYHLLGKHFRYFDKALADREFHGYPRSIPSVPSSPRGIIIDETGRNHPIANFHTNRSLVQQIPAVRGAYTSTDIGADYEKETNEGCYNDNCFDIQKLPIDYTCATTVVNKSEHVKDFHTTKPTASSNSLIQYHVQKPQGQTAINVLPEDPLKQVLHDVNICEMPNEPVLTFNELMKTVVDIPNTNEEEILTANDMIKPVMNFSGINEKLLSSKKYIDHHMPAKTFLEALNVESYDKNYTTKDKDEIKNVDWDDMFDTELFQNLRDPLPIPPPLLEAEKYNNFTIEFPKDKKKKQGHAYNKATKRSTEMKTIGTSSKVRKRTCTKSASLKKVNRTKKVKNWLDEVDPANLVEDKIGEEDDKIASKSNKFHETHIEQNKYVEKTSTITKLPETYKGPQDTSVLKTSGSLLQPLSELGEQNKKTENPETLKKILEKTIEKKPQVKKTKVVQARLAEKDGIMKFGPPAKGQYESKADITKEKETKNKEDIKEKKVKYRFVPPIKSQVPVKIMTFDVMTIDETNLNLVHNLINCEDSIAMILIFKNGFSQLNNHHTEDTCVYEGIMVQSQEKFFYLKDNKINSDLFRELLENSEVICYNAKQMLIYLVSNYGMELKQDMFKLYDAKIGGNLIDPDNPPENFAELQKLLDFSPEFTIATECALQKAAWYITLLRECFDKLKSLLTDNRVWSVFVEIEMPLLPVIAGMEYRGVSVDLEKLKSMEDILLKKMKSVEQECYKAAGKTFQINSTLQVRTILYDELQLDTKSNLKIKETIGKGAKSTSETMLRGLVSVHPLPRLILEYRHLHKAHATFLTGIAQHVKDGSVKPSWVQMAAATGRIASNNPNLQAIPKAPFSILMFPENTEDQEPMLNFRSIYTARPEHCFVAADFKHIECRVFAHAAEDATLQDALRSGQDLFRVLAAKWLNKTVEEVSTEDRERTKRIIYASLYGAGARKLMEILHISYEQALSVMSSFNRTFPALKSFGRAVVAKAASGSLRSISGRARRFPHIASADAALRAQAERQAVNFIVQGSAADLCKKAMVAVQRRFESSAVASRLVLQIHDELVWEVAADHVNIAAAIIKETMENVGRDSGMCMTLPIELTVGPNWGEMRPFDN